MGLGIQWDWGTLGQMERDVARGTMGLGHSGTERDGARDTMGLGHNGTGPEIQWDWSTMGRKGWG